MNFKVNDYLTIKDFRRTGVFTSFMKWGKPFEYERFTGKLNHEKVSGWICLYDNNIYELKKDE